MQARGWKRILEPINAADDADGGGMDCADQCRDHFRNPRSGQTLGTSSDLLLEGETEND